ncbi:hypothetical protein ACQRIU_001124 [Beauveria bassiana]
MGQLSMTLATVVSRILGEYGIPLCIIGELALNYYNVPRVCYDLEQYIIIFTANVYGLEPLEQKALQSRGIDGGISKEIADIPLEEIATLPLPRLAPFLAGLATKFILTQDDNAMIAVEQLVDGMNLDESWVDSQLTDCPQAVRDMITGLINGKQCRIDYFSDNQVTCFIRDEAEAAHVSRRSMNGIIVLGDSDDELLDVDDHEMQQLPCMTCLDKA